uniref:Protein with SprT-like domain at the N terminus n=1 Tax=Panagrellus redivivus TaxID=6233 RepID=A0A7E4V284_PANRE
MSLVDPAYELIDPNPDLHASFIQFNDQFFEGKLASVTVSWSNRMTQCAGICSFQPASGLCAIRLSEPLLKLRPRKDFVETLLHEMIHAFLFLTSRIMDRDGHGPNFQAHMHRINAVAGTKISIYHSFHAEVALYKQHWWRCDGKCQSMKPFYGYVKRSMNRAPSKNDFWWNTHQNMCGGTFIKVKSPEPKKKETKGRKKKENTTPKIDSIFKKEPKSEMVIEGGVLIKKPVGVGAEKRNMPSPGKTPKKKPKLPTTGGVKLGGIKVGGSEASGRSRLLDAFDVPSSSAAPSTPPRTTPPPGQTPFMSPPLVKLEKDDFTWDDDDIIFLEETVASVPSSSSATLIKEVSFVKTEPSSSTSVESQQPDDVNDLPSSSTSFKPSQPDVASLPSSSSIKVKTPSSRPFIDLSTIPSTSTALPRPLPRLRMEIVPENDGIEILTAKIVPRKPEIEIISAKIVAPPPPPIIEIVDCPICQTRVPLAEINPHLDVCTCK